MSMWPIVPLLPTPSTHDRDRGVTAFLGALVMAMLGSLWLSMWRAGSRRRSGR